MKYSTSNRSVAAIHAANSHVMDQNIVAIIHTVNTFLKSDKLFDLLYVVCWAQFNRFIPALDVIYTLEFIDSFKLTNCGL